MKDESVIVAGISAGDQWSALKRDAVQKCPDDILGMAFYDVCRACEKYDTADDGMCLEWMAAIVIRCELHAEIIRRLEDGTSTIAKIEGRTQ